MSNIINVCPFYHQISSLKHVYVIGHCPVLDETYCRMFRALESQLVPRKRMKGSLVSLLVSGERGNVIMYAYSPSDGKMTRYPEVLTLWWQLYQSKTRVGLLLRAWQDSEMVWHELCGTLRSAFVLTPLGTRLRSSCGLFSSSGRIDCLVKFLCKC